MFCILKHIWQIPLKQSVVHGRWFRVTSVMSFKPVVLSGPSGSGKSTLLKKLMGEFPNCFAFSVSHTTRKPRPGEVPGKDYYFVERSEMESKIKNNDFVENAEFSGNLYGTSKESIKTIHDSGRICILDVDMQGVKSIKNTDLNPRYIFISPPSIETLEERLRGRGTETEEAIQKRLGRVRVEMEYGAQEGSYDLTVVNDVLDEAYAQLRSFLINDIEEAKKTQEQLRKV